MNSIYIHYGENLQQMTYQLMDKANIDSKIKKGMNVVIKPNLVLPRIASDGATTHWQIVEGIINWFFDRDIKDISISEGSWIGIGDTQAAFDVCGFTDLAKKYNVRIFDTKDDDVLTFQYGDLDINVCKSIAQADFLINVPVLKGHCQTDVTCCLKNLKGCIPDSEKRRFHAIGLHAPIAALNTVLKPDLHIIDSVCGDLTFEEGGNPVISNRLMLGFDPVLLDSYGARLLGYDPNQVQHIKYAKDYKIGNFYNDDTVIHELNPDARPKFRENPSATVKKLEKHINEDGACSACYANLIFALSKIGTSHLNEKINIGQGFRGKQQQGIGVGACTSGFSCSLKGCPPTALEIIEFLNKNT